MSRNAATDPTLELPATLARALFAGHPWVYRDHVPARFSAPAGAFVRIRAGRFSGWALWDPDSPLALRVLSARERPSEALIAERVRRAAELRAELEPRGTTAFRLLYGEGDGIPGIVVDVYGKFAVLVTYSKALEPLVPWVVRALEATGRFQGIVRRAGRRADRARDKLAVVSGRAPPRELVVTENGIRFAVDLEAGQKTGLYLDHRENREFLRGRAAGRRVLNLYSYTGAFSLYAVAGGASRVVSVDAAAPAAAAARRNFELNGFSTAEHEFVVSDVVEYLSREDGEKFELVICDPPSMASSRAELKSALRAYARVNALALGRCAPFGLYAAASCTAQVGPEAFRGVLAEAADTARVRFQIVHEAGHAVDHPYFAGHLEGRYLKFIVGRVLPIS